VLVLLKDNLPDERLLSKRETAALPGTSPDTLDRWAARRVGPPRLRFGRRMTRYLLGPVRKWLAFETLQTLKEENA
jgi:predicted DNA-binding transcriptional regulator AlpA